jgi:arylsulfatase A-like enzyme
MPQQYLKPYLNADGSSKFAPEVAHAPGQHYGPQPFPKAGYAAMVSQMDDYVGKIMNLLAQLKLDNNTLVIFSSDNGTHVEGGRKLKDANEFFRSSGPLKGTKRALYDGGIRVPFIAYWKGKIAAHTTSSMPGAFWDIVPTVAAVTGTKAPAGDGISLLPVLLEKQKIMSRPAMYWEFYENGFKQAVRKDNWKAIRFYKGADPLRTELYNLSDDIGEKNDLAAQYPGKVKEMELIMEQERVPSDNPTFQIR